VAACYWSGQVVGFSPTTMSRGPLSSLGTNPEALASYRGTLLAADGQDRRLYQGVVDTAHGGFQQTAQANGTGSVPNQVLVAPPYVYVVNTESNTLQVLKEGAEGGRIALDAGVAGGVSLGTVAELPLGMNALPEGIALLGTSLWIPLYGGPGSDNAKAGQAVVEVSVANPEAPVELRRISLQGLDLKPFDGGTPVARPWSITTFKGALWVALNNLNPDSYVVEGPGLVARIEPGDGSVVAYDLGAEDCLNPQWLAPVGGALAVSCAGPTFATGPRAHAGVVLLDSNGERLDRWSSACPPDAGVTEDGGEACAPMVPGRFAVVGQRLVLGDQNAGRVVLLDATGGVLSEVRGLGDPLQLCPVSQSGVGNVSDVLAP
jgi:hypothetical protein